MLGYGFHNTGLFKLQIMTNRYTLFLCRMAASILCLCCFPAISLNAQISEGGLPPSFRFATGLRSTGQAVEIPVHFSVEDLKSVDAWRVSQGAPLTIAKVIDTDLNISQDGAWTTLPDGQKVWQLPLKAPGAIALLLYYSDFYIPEGGKLYIYNVDKSQVLGAYTTRSHPQNGPFATELIAGDEIILEYVPAPSGEKPSLRISGVGYGYNHLYVTRETRRTQREESGPCMVNINCEEGDDWQLQKKGVCQMVQRIGKDTYICSASLVNNTAQDKKPYILSAFHCSQTMDGLTEATDQELLQWVFYFHKEHTGCDNSSPVRQHKTMIGCTRKAAIPIEKGSDGLLLLLNAYIPDDYDVFFNGWDRSNQPSSSGVGIHHPSGDYKKISTYGNYPAESATWNNSDNNQTGARNAHWNVIFDETPNGHAVTEGGSSGSPLFNKDGLIVGTLSGGNSTCYDPEGLNLYGKLFYHWNKFSEKSNKRMDIWLDPLQTGAIRLAGMTQDGQTVETGLKPPTNLTAQKTADGNIQLEWNAPVFQQTVGWGDQSIVYEFGYKGNPFYYAQRWDAADLKPIDRKTIMAVNFIPANNVSYAVHIEQGNRTYDEDVSDTQAGKTNAVVLKEPFIIDARQDLLVGIHVKRYAQRTYPAFADNGPAIQGKGNIVAMEDKKWGTLPAEEMDANFVLSFTVTSEEGTLRSMSQSNPYPSNSYTASPSAIPCEVRQQGSSAPLLSSQEGYLIADFPEPTGYLIDRDRLELATLPASTTRYTDKNVPANAPSYQVYALYNGSKSLPATIDTGTSVGTDRITPEEEAGIAPTLFADQVNILHNESVRLLEIYAMNGRLIRKIPHPGSTINTGSLPQGVYIFKLTTDKGTKTVQGVRKAF